MLNKKGKNEEVLIGISKELQGEEGSLGLFMVIGLLKKEREFSIWDGHFGTRSRKRYCEIEAIWKTVGMQLKDPRVKSQPLS